MLRIDDYAEPALDDEDELEDCIDDGNNNYDVEDELQKYEYSKINDLGQNNNSSSSKTSEKTLNALKKTQNYENNYSRVSSAASINIFNSNSSSIANSRVATGDTGFASISDNSYSSISSKQSFTMKMPLQSQPQSHQPVIVSSNIPNNIAIKSPSSLTSKNGLKQLKSNLAAPLSTLKFQKN